MLSPQFCTASQPLAAKSLQQSPACWQKESHQQAPVCDCPPQAPRQEPAAPALQLAELPSAAALHTVLAGQTCVVDQGPQSRLASALEQLLELPSQPCPPTRFCTEVPLHCHWVL